MESDMLLLVVLQYITPRSTKIASLLLLFLKISGVKADSHSLLYYCSVLSTPRRGQLNFHIHGYLDDIHIMSYSSDDGQDRPVALWMKKEGAEFWHRETLVSKRLEIIIKEMMKITMRRFNHTGGFHYGQWISSCELRDDGSTFGDTNIRYDGEDFIHLDTQRGIWIPTTYEAELTTQGWNSAEGRWGDLQRSYVHNDCIYWLKRFTEHGREDLEKKVRPEVKVWSRRQSDIVLRLQCLVYGFHPRAVDVKWVRNGVDDVPSDEMSPILPHPDSTYQIRISAEVPTRKGDTYACHVDHSSLQTVLIVKLEPDGRLRGVFIGAVIGCLFLVAVVIYRFYLYKNGGSGTAIFRNA